MTVDVRYWLNRLKINESNLNESSKKIVSFAFMWIAYNKFYNDKYESSERERTHATRLDCCRAFEDNKEQILDSLIKTSDKRRYSVKRMNTRNKSDEWTKENFDLEKCLNVLYTIRYNRLIKMYSNILYYPCELYSLVL